MDHEFNFAHTFPNIYLAALESVFPQTELTTFIPLTRVEKEEKLNGLTQLVTGIRLFNKQLGKGGETIDNCKMKELYH